MVANPSGNKRGAIHLMDLLPVKSKAIVYSALRTVALYFAITAISLMGSFSHAANTVLPVPVPYEWVNISPFWWVIQVPSTSPMNGPYCYYGGGGNGYGALPGATYFCQQWWYIPDPPPGKPLACPANSWAPGNTWSTASTCICNTSYKPNGSATQCVSVTASDPAKNTGQLCTFNKASAQAVAQTNACTNPINSGTGNKYQYESDYVGVGVHSLRVERVYNSGGTIPSVIEATVWGSQWRGNYDRSIGYSSNGTISIATVKREDGKQYYFNLTGANFVGDADVGGILRRQVDATGAVMGWTYVNEQDEIETYDATGKLVSITNRAGQTQTLTYSDGTAGANGGYVLDATGVPTATVLPAGSLIRATDPAGRTLQFGYDAAGRIVRLADPADRVYAYAYSGPLVTDNLISVTYPDGKVRIYLYGETANVSATPDAGVSYAHALTGIIDENGARYASWTYDAAGRAVSSEHGAFGSGIDHVGLVYGTPDANGNSMTTVTDVMGVSRSYNFTTTLGIVRNTGITGQPCNGCSAALTYDANGNVASRTDFNGNTSCYAYDPTRNLETVRIEGLPVGSACPVDPATYALPATAGSIIRKISTQWHATLRLPTLVAEPLRVTTYTYDAKGNLLSKTIQPTTDSTGGTGVSATANGTARIITYTYNAAGQVVAIDGPRADVTDVTNYGYDAQGNLVSATNALNRVTTLGSYDAHGRPGTLTDPNGLVTSFTYDVRGRFTSRSEGGEVTSYNYDGVGNLTGVTLPNGAAYTYSYDAPHRLTQITDALGNKLLYALDNAGNRTKEQLYDAAGNLSQSKSRVFNNLSRLVQDIGAVNQTTTYTYDAKGNLLTITDPLNRQTINTYDALNRLSQVTNADNGIIRYGYDGLDQLTRVTDPRNLVTQYTRDGLGNLDQQSSPDTGVTANTYDAAGNLLTRTDAKGQVASYTYDALNRLTGISYSGGTAPVQTVSYQYDQGVNGIGHLTQISDASGTLNYSYDQHGRLTAESWQTQAGTTYITAYSYDNQGRPIGITYPSGRTVNYTLDTTGRIGQIATTFNGITKTLVSNIAYEPFGGVHSFTYGDGLTAPIQTYTRQRDQDGRIASYTLNGRALSLGYDTASQISSITDPLNPLTPANYAYDPLSRLTSYIQNTTSQSYGYDPVGNRTSKTLGATTTTYSYATDSNRLTGIQVGAVVPLNVAHDANGAITNDATRQYAYDLRGRLIQTTTALGVIHYEVNALGLRVRKQAPYANIDTLYHYDAEGHLIAENEAASTRYREYIWLGDQPVVVMQ